MELNDIVNLENWFTEIYLLTGAHHNFYLSCLKKAKVPLHVMAIRPVMNMHDDVIDTSTLIKTSPIPYFRSFKRIPLSHSAMLP